MEPPENRHSPAAENSSGAGQADSTANLGGTFNTTHWSLVMLAAQDSSPPAQDALAKLCRGYWYPLYVFVRRRGYSPHDAQDLTQGFFERLLDKNYLSGADRTKGKFRSFLLAALEHFLANDWRRGQAQKRGGGARMISIDDDAVEEQYLQLASPSDSPEKMFERQWAATLLEQVVTRLKTEFCETGRGALFESLKIFLTGEKHSGKYAELALTLGMTEPAVKMAVSRMRHRYGELLREEIGKTVSSPAQVDEELRCLLAALS